jgi:DNA modification methylase
MSELGVIADYYIREEEVPLSKLKPNPKNPRKHPEKLLKKLEASIQTFGKVVPIIVDEEYNILAGHARLKTAQRLGMETFTVRVFKFTPQLAKLFSLADNKIAELSEWDDLLLAEVFEELEYVNADLEVTGFDSEEIDAILKELNKTEPTDDIDVIIEEVGKREPITKRGDVWLLGKHRLMCGDSTSDDVIELMDKTVADLFFTDPPYGVSYGEKVRFLETYGRSGRLTADIENDSLPPEEMYKLWVASFSIAKDSTKAGGCYYICTPSGNLMLPMMQAVKESGWGLRHGLVWVKNSMVFSGGRLDYNYKHEPVLYGWKEGKHEFHGGGNETLTWEINRPQISKLHPTMKPIELCSRAIKNSSKRGGIVLDLFGGSGSTLIACEQLDRTCYMMEIDPQYCDVIIKRWEDFTQQKARKR